jgi:hypothetical protein
MDMSELNEDIVAIVVQLIHVHGANSSWIASLWKHFG